MKKIVSIVLFFIFLCGLIPACSNDRSKEYDSLNNRDAANDAADVSNAEYSETHTIDGEQSTSQIDLENADITANPEINGYPKNGKNNQIKTASCDRSQILPITLFIPQKELSDGSVQYSIKNAQADFYGFSLTLCSLNHSEQDTKLVFTVHLPDAWEQECNLWNRTLFIRIFLNDQETDAFRDRTITPMDDGRTYEVCYHSCTLSAEDWSNIQTLTLVPVLKHCVSVADAEFPVLNDIGILTLYRETAGSSYASKSNLYIDGNFSYSQIDTLSLTIEINPNSHSKIKAANLHPIIVWDEDYTTNEAEGRYTSKKDSAGLPHGSYSKVIKDFSEVQVVLTRLVLSEEGPIIEIHIVFPETWSELETRSMFHWLVGLSPVLELVDSNGIITDRSQKYQHWWGFTISTGFNSDSVQTRNNDFSDVYFTLYPKEKGFNYEKWHTVKTITIIPSYTYYDTVGGRELTEKTIYDGGWPSASHFELLEELAITVNLDETIFHDGL